MTPPRRLPQLVAALLVCGAGGCGAEPAPGGAPAGDTGREDPQDSGWGADTADTGAVPEACSVPEAERDSLVGEPGAEAGRALAFVGGAVPRLALGVPEAAGGAGVVLLTAPDSFEAPTALSATGVATLGRALSAGEDGGLAAAALGEDQAARVFWVSDLDTAPADLAEGASYAALGDGAGVSLAVSGDASGAALLVGLPRASREGSVWVAPPPDTPGQPLAGSELWGEEAADYAGSVVRTVGDLDGDGVTDAAVGAFGARGEGPLAGRLYLVRGPWSEGALADAAGVLRGAEGYDLFGWSVDGGPDLDGDGLSDVVVGAPGTNGADLSTGAAHVFVGPAAGGLGVEDAWATVEGVEGDTRLGWSVAALAGPPARVAVGGPGHRTNGGGVWVSAVEEGQMSLGEAVLESDGGAGAGGTLAAGDPARTGCDLLAVGAPDGSRIWVLGGP